MLPPALHLKKPLSSGTGPLMTHVPRVFSHIRFKVKNICVFKSSLDSTAHRLSELSFHFLFVTKLTFLLPFSMEFAWSLSVWRQHVKINTDLWTEGSAFVPVLWEKAWKWERLLCDEKDFLFLHESVLCHFVFVSWMTFSSCLLQIF